MESTYGSSGGDFAQQNRLRDNFSSSTLSIPGEDSKPSTAVPSASPSKDKIDQESLNEKEDEEIEMQDVDLQRETTVQEKEQDRDGTTPEPTASVAPSVNNFASIPNGGLQAWLQVLGSFFLFVNSW